MSFFSVQNSKNLMIPSDCIWECLTEQKTLEKLNSEKIGLSQKEANVRLASFGLNVLRQVRSETVVEIFFRQFSNPLMWVLVIAAVVAFLLGRQVDGSIIGFVLIFNAILGSVQEGRAQNSLNALSRYSKTYALVVREGKKMICESKDLVPGDVIVLREGDAVPADARLLEIKEFSVDEASLTGESQPSVKIVFTSDSPLPLQEQKNLVFKGTHVLSGTAHAVVIRTGLDTEIGKLSAKIAGIDTEIPLKKNLRRLAYQLIIISITTAIVIAGLGYFVGGGSLEQMIFVGIALLIAVVPEGLPLVLTLILSHGVSRMAKQNVLVKRLQAVEALGQAHILAVDKTGTLTKNELIVKVISCKGDYFSVSGSGYETAGEVFRDGNIVTKNDSQSLKHLGEILALSSNAGIFEVKDDTTGNFIKKITGDPTEAAMLILGEKIGFTKNEMLKSAPLVSEIPFSYERKFYANAHERNGKVELYATGAPETLLSRCISYWTPGGVKELTKADKDTLRNEIYKATESGFRVILIAKKVGVPTNIQEHDVQELTYVGYVGMTDSMRPEVHNAMKIVTEAGVRVVMITGDHKNTAISIATEAGIYFDGDTVLTGVDIDQLSIEELSRHLERTSVFARVTPLHKLKIIEAYQYRGDIIAMTGDGVNDVPSLVAADLGVAMGRIGTDVTKEASDIILLDDNFGNIGRAVQEGRHMYASIKKVLLFLLATNLGEVLVISTAILLLLPLPFTPAQIIWLNLVTDSFLVVALAYEPFDPSLLTRRFKKRTKNLLSSDMFLRMAVMALTMTIGTLAVYFIALDFGIAYASTMALTTLAVFQWFNSLNSNNLSFFKTRFTLASIKRHKPLFFMTCLVVVLHSLVLYIPFFQDFFNFVPLQIRDWALIALVASSTFFIEEIRRWTVR